MLLPNASHIVKSNCKIKFCFPDVNGNIKITLTDKLNNLFVHNFQDLNELNKIFKKSMVRAFESETLNPKMYYKSRYIFNNFVYFHCSHHSICFLTFCFIQFCFYFNLFNPIPALFVCNNCTQSPAFSQTIFKFCTFKILPFFTICLKNRLYFLE